MKVFQNIFHKTTCQKKKGLYICTRFKKVKFFKLHKHNYHHILKIQRNEQKNVPTIEKKKKK